MCGICGFLGSKETNENKEAILRSMMGAMKHRGPDSEGVHITDDAALGFVRLSIIDLSDAGTQPMYNEDGKLTLVFNGEIYNYKKLRKELQELGHTFANHSDSETLLHGYESWGKGLVQKIRGMFGFGIWDENEKKFFAARDFFGIKPFFYTIVDGAFVFASEIKCLLEYPGFHKEVNQEVLEQYLSFQYSPLEETFFKGVYRLLPGHFLTWKAGQIDIERYFDPMLTPKNMGTDEEIIDRIDKTMDKSVKRHMIADVEVGAFLSGGVDSSYIAAKFTGKKAFTVGFLDDAHGGSCRKGSGGQDVAKCAYVTLGSTDSDEQDVTRYNHKYSEIGYARELAEKLGLEHYTKIISKEEYWESIPKVMYHLDEPSGDAAGIALYFVAQEAAKHVKVVTSGEGSDELFGGYNIYLEPHDLRYLSWLPKRLRKAMAKAAEKLPDVKGKNYIIRASKDVEERFIGNARIFSDKERKELLVNKTPAKSTFDLLKTTYKKVSKLEDMNKMQYVDLNYWLPGDILQKADKMSMAHSLELRVPFLDRDVFELARCLPTKAKVRDHQTKYLFRKATERCLPQDNADRRKLGFPVPIRVWLKEEPWYSEVKTLFTSDAAKEFFHPEKLVALLDEHKAGHRDNSRKIWTVFAFLIWHKVFFEEAA